VEKETKLAEKKNVGGFARKGKLVLLGRYERGSWEDSLKLQPPERAPTERKRNSILARPILNLGPKEMGPSSKALKGGQMEQHLKGKRVGEPSQRGLIDGDDNRRKTTRGFAREKTVTFSHTDGRE